MSNTYTNLDNLSVGLNGADVVTLSSSGLAIGTVTGTTVVGTTSVTASGILSTKIGAATIAANITALPIAKSFYRISSSININIKGIAAGADGQLLDLYFSGGTHTLTITPQSTAAATAARIITMTTAATLVTTGSGFASFIYSTTDSRWLCKYLST